MKSRTIEVKSRMGNGKAKIGTIPRKKTEQLASKDVQTPL